MSSQIQNKLWHYEAQPPEEIWDKIAASLNENLLVLVAEKIYQYQAKPDVIVWQNIVAQLEAPVREEAKVVPFYVRHRRPLKYSGAVAIFIFLAVLTSLLFSKKAEPELPAEGIAKTVAEKKDNAKTSFHSTQTNSLTAPTERNNRNSLIAKSKITKTWSGQNQNLFLRPWGLLPYPAYQYETVNSSIASDKYIIYSDGKGNVVRLPKKIFNAFACPSGDVECKQRLEQLRKKFAASAMTADFTGLLQILKSLQENQ